VVVVVVESLTHILLPPTRPAAQAGAGAAEAAAAAAAAAEV
jgi:hypothetical protein